MKFQSSLIVPAGANASIANGPLPLVIYFEGLGSSGGHQKLSVASFQRSAPRPFVVATPIRPQGLWWVLSDDGEWGWLDGDFLPSQVSLIADWVRFLAEQPDIDKDSVSIMGFSAGAYAATELLAHGGVNLRCVVLGGVHGHGQPDLQGVQGKRLKRDGDTVIRKWEAYMKRLRSHSGASGGIAAVHHPDDRMSPFSYANCIFDVLTTRQLELGYAAVVVDSNVALDSTKRSKCKTAHNYKEAIFQARVLAFLFQDVTCQATRSEPSVVADVAGESSGRQRVADVAQGRSRCKAHEPSKRERHIDRGDQGQSDGDKHERSPCSSKRSKQHKSRKKHRHSDRSNTERSDSGSAERSHHNRLPFPSQSSKRHEHSDRSDREQSDSHTLEGSPHSKLLAPWRRASKLGDTNCGTGTFVSSPDLLISASGETLPPRQASRSVLSSSPVLAFERDTLHATSIHTSKVASQPRRVWVPGGTAHVECREQRALVVRVSGRVGWHVDCVNLHLHSGQTQRYGDASGGSDAGPWELDHDELIVAVEQLNPHVGYLGSCISFETSKNRCIQLKQKPRKRRERIRIEAPGGSQIHGLVFEASRLVSILTTPLSAT